MVNTAVLYHKLRRYYTVIPYVLCEEEYFRADYRWGKEIYSGWVQNHHVQVRRVATEPGWPVKYWTLRWKPKGDDKDRPTFEQFCLLWRLDPVSGMDTEYRDYFRAALRAGGLLSKQ